MGLLSNNKKNLSIIYNLLDFVDLIYKRYF